MPQSWLEEYVVDATEPLEEVAQQERDQEETIEEELAGIAEANDHATSMDGLSVSSTSSYTSYAVVILHQPLFLTYLPFFRDPLIDVRTSQLHINSKEEFALQHPNGSSSQPFSNAVANEQKPDETLSPIPMVT